MHKYDLSVIIPSVNSYDNLRGTIAALRAQEGTDGIEIIVVDRLGEHVRDQVRQNFPGTVVISVAPDTPIPKMRELAIKAVSPGVAAVGVIEDHVIVPSDWSRRMLDKLANGHDVVGGAIENAATESYIDWSSFLCEYSGSLPPVPSGPQPGVPGNNVLYRREVLDRYHAVLEEGKWENRLHDAMRADGIELIMCPEIIVGHKMHYTFGLYFTQRYLYSRSYAGARVKDAPLKTKLFYGAAAFALPPLMFLRTVKTVWSKGVHKDHLIKSLPVLVPFCIAWGAGEIMGYWFGAGNAMSKVR